ncbi:hypothetical protein EYR41_000659 [Orbilia oligospora]|uniref:Nucleoside phosphorylase domain-containing protein n=1 Tax=Orbilia oligospora TaxID=2813651 RepID=A0A8H2E6U8_ORBOL|nr:hypothetical protein EYR41_000659 [Orbilia oligospora]
MTSRDDFEICIICALPLEANAVQALFEEVKEENPLGKAPDDINTYSTGKIGNHNVVLVYMPGMGKVPAAGVSVNLKQSFKNIRLALLVGICGGVPGKTAEGVMLGDIIVGKQIVHYDFGRQYENGFVMKDGPEDSSGRQGHEIRSFVKKLEAGKEALGKKLSDYLGSALKHWGPEKINSLEDILFPSDYWHVHQTPGSCSDGRCRNLSDLCEVALKASCEDLGCDTTESERPPELLRRQSPSIYFGSVASGDKVMRSATLRDSIAQREGVIAFDMEAAGVWDYLPCILIKGVCDYSDSHKNKDWQEYAAVAAAAFAKAVLEQWTSSRSGESPKAAKPRGGPVFNNNNSKIGNQAETMTFSGNTTFSF